MEEKLRKFLDELQINGHMEKKLFYKSAYVSNEIIRTNNDYHGTSYFSDVEVFISDKQVEDGLWCGKVCINFGCLLKLFWKSIGRVSTCYTLIFFIRVSHLGF